MPKSSGRKAIESYIKHEDIIDEAVVLGQQHGLDVSATENNDPNGDIRVAQKDCESFLKLLGETIDQNQKARGKSNE